MKAIWNGTIIAESNDTIVVEGNHYFPPASVHTENLSASTKTTSCPWKGTASYVSLVVDGGINTDAAWFYPEPKEAASNITGYYAFWNGVTVS